MKLSPNDRGEM